MFILFTGGHGMASIFSKILAGELPASFVYRDELVAAFLDIHPINLGHTLVVPIREVQRVYELDETTNSRLFSVAVKISLALRKSALRCEDITFSMADGVAANQDVPHVHLHVIPRFVADGFGWRFPSGYGAIPPQEILEQTASAIRSCL